MNENPDDLSSRLHHSLSSASAPELSDDIVTGAAARTAPRLSNPARTWRVAGGATAALAVVAVGALVIAPTFQQQAPLFTASGNANASPMAAESDASTSDLRIGMWVNYDYVAGPGLSTSGGNGDVYELKRVGSPEQRAAEVAAAFGLEGTAAKSQYFDPAYPSWVVGTEDGTGPSVTVSWTGTGNWWFNDPTASAAFECSAPSSDGQEPIAPDACVVPQPTLAESVAPSKDEARVLAHDIFAATGFDIAAGDITVTADEWQTMATANLVVDGVGRGQRSRWRRERLLGRDGSGNRPRHRPRGSD
jgi:hypothetical protein